ncbi:phospholipase D-like domain-containing protein [Paenibacillus sp. GP183]|uniref:phospholipase D-like domain-containing protein n=1 Tax=Paenibacillus sp. GP183 TaxID=1882751 RepID=UPI00089B4D17|nr:phospholipase D-like domain-containing protein [Paenibacillus sp. GP183]SEB91949.1 Phosphatidylserine/phosphatidylglycerophosphate/cardiolipin synthase [Paenibacillus sp. GP183]
MKLVVYANGDCSYVLWSIEDKLADCLGFALHRKINGYEEIVANHVGFSGESNPSGIKKPSDVWPIQEFSWFDYDVNPGDSLQYQVVPMYGTKDDLEPQNHLASNWSDIITISNDQQKAVLSVFFNRGIVMSQWIARQIDGSSEPPVKVLKEKLQNLDSAVRKFLSGRLGQELIQLLNTTRINGGHVYIAVFELNDPQLIEALCEFGNRAHVVLANGSASSGSDENAAARVRLKQNNVDVRDRMLRAPHLGHNKFMVICDIQQNPVSVWTGSTNWSTTGLCTQANNAILIKDSETAQIFRDQWDRLAQAGNEETTDLKNANAEVKTEMVGKNKVSIYFTPTPHQEEMTYASRFIQNAKEGILFLQFNPGSLQKGTLLDDVIERARLIPLYIRGVVNQDLENSDKTISLTHGGNYIPSNFQVILPNGVSEAGAYFANEIKANQFKAPGGIGHAIIHSKVIVIDPLSSHPVVITGSHNMGSKASAQNDENLVIIENDRDLAISYAVNIKSLYDHYRWRFRRGMGDTHWDGLSVTDIWQDGFLQQKAKDNFWLKKL